MIYRYYKWTQGENVLHFKSEGKCQNAKDNTKKLVHITPTSLCKLVTSQRFNQKREKKKKKKKKKIRKKEYTWLTRRKKRMTSCLKRHSGPVWFVASVDSFSIFIFYTQILFSFFVPNSFFCLASIFSFSLP